MLRGQTGETSRHPRDAHVPSHAGRLPISSWKEVGKEQPTGVLSTGPIETAPGRGSGLSPTVPGEQTQTTSGNDITLWVTHRTSFTKPPQTKGGWLTRGCTLTPSHTPAKPRLLLLDPNRPLSVPRVCRAAETPGLSGLQATRATCWEFNENAGCRVGWEKHGGDWGDSGGTGTVSAGRHVTPPGPSSRSRSVRR